MAGDFADIAREAQSPQFRQYMVELLHDLVAIDTTPRADIAALASLEGRVFDAIEGRLNGLGIAGLGVWRVPISPRIEEHRLYSQPYYTATPQHPRGQSADLAYGNRCNLVATIDPSGGGAAPGLALNAHIDVVKPYIPARIESDTVFGRGACDDKGPLASTVGAIKLCASHLQRSGKRITRPITAMFVIDEEIGGNGSLSLAIDRAFRRRYDTLAVLECCSSNIYPANRGAVWYKVEATLPGVNLFETAAFIIEEMECEGRALKAESRHDLFPHRPVQTCHGMIGGFGEHPSRICGRVEFVIRSTGAAGNLSLAVPLVRDLIEDGLAQYVGLYGDKTKALDPSTGKPKVDHHYDLESTESGVIVRVHGSTGHMGSILQNDGAITKMATMVRSLTASRAAIEKVAGGPVRFDLLDWVDGSHLLMEGGQGFLPTHAMEQVMDRLRCAVWRGARRYLELLGRQDVDIPSTFAVTFDKLHNAAFAGDANSTAMRRAIAAARDAGIWKCQPVLGWDVSCDARIFACEYPADLTVITTGPGHLIHAHADDEQISISELVAFTSFLARFILGQTT